MHDNKRFFDWEYTKRFTERHLTTYDDKARLYAVEASFRETLHACATERSDELLGERVRGVGLGLFRPDAIRHGKVEAALEYFARLGLRPFYCTTVDVPSTAVRDIWRYQLNVASGERIRLLDMLFSATPSVFALFAADPDAIDVPCAAIMADSKGEAEPTVREGWELRSHLDSPHRIEVYVHVADEPVDVVRDGGILLGPEGFAAALAPTRGDVTSQVVEAARIVNRVHGEHARTVVVDDPLLTAVLRDGPAQRDRWQVLLELGNTCEMYAGPGENIICDPGTDAWWERAGMLEQRTEYLSSRIRALPTPTT